MGLLSVALLAVVSEVLVELTAGLVLGMVSSKKGGRGREDAEVVDEVGIRADKKLRSSDAVKLSDAVGVVCVVVGFTEGAGKEAKPSKVVED